RADRRDRLVQPRHRAQSRRRAHCRHARPQHTDLDAADVRCVPSWARRQVGLGVRILYHHRTASKDGQPVHIEELIAALRARGHEVRVVGPEAPSGAGMGAQTPWVHRLRATLPKGLYELLEFAYTLVAYWRLRKAAAEFAPDVIYERYNLYLLAGWLLKRRLRLPLLLEVNAPLALERGRYGGLGLPRFARWAER